MTMLIMAKIPKDDGELTLTETQFPPKLHFRDSKTAK